MADWSWALRVELALLLVGLVVVILDSIDRAP